MFMADATDVVSGAGKAVSNVASGAVDGVKNLFDKLSQNSEEAEKEAKERGERDKAVIDAVFNGVDQAFEGVKVDSGMSGKGVVKGEEPFFSL